MSASGDEEALLRFAIWRVVVAIEVAREALVEVRSAIVSLSLADMIG